VRVPTFLACAAVALVLGLVIAGVAVLREPLPRTEGEIVVPGLDADVEVVRDAAGIPQVYADTDVDLMRAQGYVHAQERFFQMDLRRHATAGRLSELFGETTLEADKMVRTMGWRRVAEQEWGLLKPDTRAALSAYADGVNAYLAQRSTLSLAAEYTVLRLNGLTYAPEPWTPVDSLAWLKAMAWDLRGNMDDEIDRVLLSLDHTPTEVAQLHPPYDEQARSPIVTDGAVLGGRFDQDAPAQPRTRGAVVPAAAADAFARTRAAVDAVPTLVGRGSEVGSNSWVVSGEHTESGEPLLANDPHLGVSQPGVWMQMGLHCRTRTPECTLGTAGFTFAGVPGVIIGHNEDVAWGFTNLGADVTDLYLEQVVGDDRWVQDGRERPLAVRTETIEVRGGEPFELRVRETSHGPLVSDVSRELASVGANAPATGADRGTGYAVALAWTALDPAPTADAILMMNRASNWKEFRRAAASFTVPAQNLVYADTEGHIGYQAPGRVPVRARGHDGRMPVEGWHSRNDWTGEHVPFDELPSVLDPEEGFVVTANQAGVGRDYPHHLTDDWDQGYRSERIRDLLTAATADGAKVDVDDMTRIQLDTRHPAAASLVPHLLRVDLAGSYAEDGQKLLADWDHDQPAGSSAAAYFNVVWSNLLSVTFHDDLNRRAWPDGGSRWVRVVEEILQDPRSPWWDDVDTPEVETRDDVLRTAMVRARDELTTRRSVEPEDWEWGHLHRLDLAHDAFGEVGFAPLRRLFGSTGWKVGGGSSTVDATAWDATVGYGVSSAPSMRMVVSVGTWDDSVWIDLTGVSGHPMSPHYRDQTERWVAGEYLDWAFTRGAVRDAGERVLRLRAEHERSDG